MRSPWWMDRVAAMLAPHDVSGLELGALWRLRERLHFVRENVEPALLRRDVADVEGAGAAWADFERRESSVHDAHARSGEHLAARLRSGDLGPASFRAAWESLGFARNDEGSGTPADDYLDGLLHLSRLTADATPLPFGMLNLASRAAQVADFLTVTQPGHGDVVFDLGSGSGKLALTVAASAATAVRGVEVEGSYVTQAQRSASWLGLGNAVFDAADVRDVDLSPGSIFYLYYPFHGTVARGVAERLGALGREKDITLYVQGPALDYGEHFLAQVDTGALTLSGRRGEFGQVLVLESARG